MKKLIILAGIILSIPFHQSFSRQPDSLKLLQSVFNDSLIHRNLFKPQEFETQPAVFYEKTMCFSYLQNILTYENHNCLHQKSAVGMIRKLRFRENKASVKIYREDSNLFVKVRLVRDAECQPWRIRKRLIYNNLIKSKKQDRILIFTYDS
jgi:hypothetical protein